MTPLFLFRLFLDLAAVSLLLAAMGYYWSGNALHEIMGTAMFLLLVATQYLQPALVWHDHQGPP